MVQRVASRYLIKAMKRCAAFSMDMFARLSILEGAAGVSPGTWLRRGALGFGDALEHFGAHLAVPWTSTRNEGIYDKALSTAGRVLSRNSALDPADLVQDLVVSSTRSSGTDRSRLFHTIGKKLRSHKNDLGNGKIGPRDSKILGPLGRWVQHAAFSELKKWQAQSTRSFAEKDYDVSTTPRAVELDEDKRQLLMLLALQSPGGLGAELRRTIDRLIDQHWPHKSTRAVVKGFFQKMSEPKYRSPDQMRKMVTKFTPERWLTQTINLIRRELMEELGIAPQALTNILGGKARNIFKFLREKVAKDPKIKAAIENLAQEIELLEPGASRVASERRYELTEDQTPLDSHEVMLEWLRQIQHRNDGDGDGDEKKADRHPDLLHDIFEKDMLMEWGAGVGPHIQHSRGPVELRLARRYLLKQLREEQAHVV